MVVTAQRRAENLQQVPLSVNALSAAEIKNADISDVNRLEQAIPGFRVGRSGPAARPAIRGVYTEQIGSNADPRIGFYIDEIYQSRTQQGNAAFIDLERVEVQKGPQGTLFGRNSYGGNLAITTATPKDTFDAGAELIAGNYNRVKVDGFINQPIADGLSARLAAAYERRDGVNESIVNPDADFGDRGYYYLRGSLKWTPKELDNKLEVLVHASYQNTRDRGSGLLNGKNLGALVETSFIRQPGQSLNYNGVTYPFPLGYNGGNYTGTLVPYITTARDGIPDINGADIGLPIPGKYKNTYNQASFERIQQQNYSGTVSYDVTPWLRLRSITGYTDFAATNFGDGDGSPAPISEYYIVTKAETFTQEFQAQSSNRQSPFQYTVGAFYMYDNVHDNGSTIYQTHNYNTSTALANGLPRVYASGNSCGFTLLPNTSSCNINNLNSADGTGPQKAFTLSWAGYAQGSYTFFDKLTFTGGIRYTVDHKNYKAAYQNSPFTTFVGDYVVAQNNAFLASNPNATQGQLPFPNAASVAARRPDGTATGFTAGTGYHAIAPYTEAAADSFNDTCGGFTPLGFAAAGNNMSVGTVPNYLQTRCATRDFSYATYRLAVDYKFDRDHLVYASFNTGAHSGGFGASFRPQTITAGTFATFNTEKVEAWEIGSKNQFFDDRLQVNLAAFYNNFTHVQIQGTQQVDSGNNSTVSIATIQNGPSEHAPGFELSFIAKPVPRLTLNGGFNYLHARYSVFPQGIFYSGLCDITQAAGSPCTGYPATSNSGVGSGFFPNPATNPELFVPVVYNANGTVNQYGTLFYGKKTRVQNTPDWSAQFGASYEISLGTHGRLVPEVQTLYSGDYLLSAALLQYYQTSYFKTDARLTYYPPNEKISVQVFVENLENVATVGRVTTGNLSASGTYADPRTFGARISYRY